MVERVGCEKKTGKMKDDEELEMLLGEIPHATSLNHHHHYTQTTNGYHGHGNGYGYGDGASYFTQSMNGMMYGMYDDDPSCSYKHHTCVSPVSGFSLHSDGSSSSLFSVNGGQSLSDNGSLTPPQFEDLRSHFHSRSPHYPNGLPPSDIKLADSSFGKRIAQENVIDQLRLSRSLSKMYISDEQEDELGQFCDGSHGNGGTGSMNFVKFVGGADNCSKAISDYMTPVSRSPMSLNGELGSALFGYQQGYGTGSSMGMQYVNGQADSLFSQSIGSNGLTSSPCHGTRGQNGYYYPRGLVVPNLGTSASWPSMANASLCSRQIGVMEERGSSSLPNLSHLTLSRSNNMGNGNQFPSTSNARVRSPSIIRVPQGDLETLSYADGLILEGDGLNNVTKRGFGDLRGQCKKGSLHEIGEFKPQERRSQIDSRGQFAGACENGRSARMHCPLSLPVKCNTLADAQGYIFFIAKDQHGCRFLQKIFDEGSPRDVQIIFNEIIGHVVELMINPFGNYLMQKLLEVCNEEQRMRILLVVTDEPGELVRISLNTHGTRVVQKLIETLKTRQQISLVISALEPGFLNLIKDLNGNHVVQRCLQCLSNEDNKFIFVAAAKYCVDIATHQHGCCVLQRCISHSTGDHHERLVAEISANGLLLAQDAYGNYVVQFILDLKIPSATSKLISQFEGNYVHLSTQKFSSHVVEKCLLVLNNEARSMIIHELLYANHFEQLLQDPHANYVVQRALEVAEGPLHNSLVNAIESHKAISRNSPYSKRIFSPKLLKK